MVHYTMVHYKAVRYNTVQPYKMVQIQNGTDPKWYRSKMVHSRKGVHVTNGTLQNGTALQNGKGSKWYIVVNRYMLKTVRYKTVQLQNGTQTFWYVT
jgi:hypothetical protein